MKFLNQAQWNMAIENIDEIKDDKRKEFDFIVVGAGSAGCAVAARLTENPNWNVLLLEAGPQENLLMDIPGLVPFLQLSSKVNWDYRAESSNSSCLAMKNNRCRWPRGRVMGGSSVLNFMIYTRANKKCYDRWEALGNAGWSYADVLPYFIKSERNFVKSAASHMRGTLGPIPVSEIPWKSEAAQQFVQAAKQLDLPYIDYNGATQIGVSYLQSTTRNGVRVSSNVAYLYPIKHRQNLFIRKMSHVTKILIHPNTNATYGVQYSKNGQIQEVYAAKEVILSAGAINSPQLLMLSGIGPAEHLNEMQIKPIVDLRVGENLMDHTAAGALTIKVNVSTLQTNAMSVQNFIDFQSGNGVFTSTGGCESLVFLNFENQTDMDAWPDIELLQIGGSIYSFNALFRHNFNLRDELMNSMFGDLIAHKSDAFMVFPMVLRPKSRGRILLKNPNPFTHPKMYSNYFTDPDGYDMRVSVNSIKKLIELLEAPAMKQINARLHKTPVPACAPLGFGTDEYWACYTRYFTFSIYHYSGTCKMGPKNDKTAVVDPRLRVYGVSRLRVVDASISIIIIIILYPNKYAFKSI